MLLPKSRPVRVASLVLGFVALTAVLAGVIRTLRHRAAEADAGPVATFLSSSLELGSTVGDDERRLIEALRAAATAPAGVSASVTVDYPQEGSIFPPEIVAPRFLWHDGTLPDGKAGEPTAAAADRSTTGADSWLVDVTLGDGGRVAWLVPGEPAPQGTIDTRCISERNEIYKPTPYQATARTFRPDAAVWEAIKKHSVERPATVSIVGYRRSDATRAVSTGRMTFTTSRDPVGAPIFYRDVPLMPSQTEEGVIKPLAKGALPLIIWRLKDIGRDDSRAMLTDMPTCANCHSFSHDGRTMGMDIDGPQGDRGAYALVPIAERVSITYKDVLTWNAFTGKPKDFTTIGFLSRVSPDGRHVASTVNEALYVQNFWDYKFNQVFYPTRGIIAIYSAETRGIEALPGADDPAYVHCDPTWSADGKTIVFARAAAKDPYPAGRPLAAYAGDPNEVPIQYDLYRIPFNDGRGGAAVPIAGASANGMSNNFPKISPDGKWIVYVQCRNGQLMRPDSRLYIVPIEGGASRPLRANLPLMNSWHSFSPNGRWLVFSSKTNTPYTQMFLTHLDPDGNDSPAILIDNATAANRAVNLPEFVNTAYDGFRAVDVPAVDHTRRFNHGTDLALKGQHEAAVTEFRAALQTEPNDWKTSEWRIHESLSKSLLVLGRRDEALKEIAESLRQNPYNAEMQTNLANILFEAGDRQRALQHIDYAVRLMPKSAVPWYNRATMRLKEGDRAGALADFGEAISRDPTNPAAWYGRAAARMEAGDRTGALSDLAEALRVAPPDWPKRTEAESRQQRLRANGGA